MAVLVILAMLMLAMTGHASCTWCVCKEMSDSALQKTLDYACGSGADCSPIHQNGPCYSPNTVRAHCSYAVNSFFQRKNQAAGTCDFAGTATISASDPSYTGCSFPATLSAAGTSTTTTPPTPVTTTPSTSTGTPSTNGTPATTTTTSPYTTTPSSGGVLGGINGVGPSGVGTNNDYSHGGLRLLPTTTTTTSMLICVVTMLASSLMAMMPWWG